MMFSSTTTADWFEATGQAPIRQGNLNDAKARATEDAVRRALLYAGASISSVQQVTDGLLTQDELVLSSQAEVRQIQLVSEQRIGGVMEVTIRADIFPQQQQCHGANFKKPLVISPFLLRHSQHSVIGDLQSLGLVSAEKIFRQLQDLSTSSVVHWYDNPTLARPLTKQERSSLLRQTNSDYLVTASIDDVSLGERSDRNLRFWSDARRDRFFHMRLQLQQLSTGRVLFQQEYRTQARWDFRKRTTISPQNHRFWQTAYGESIQRVLNAAVVDIDDTLRCEPFQAAITEVANNRIRLDAGENVGVKSGTELTILFRQESVREGATMYRVSPLTVKVSQVGFDWAMAESIDQALLSNVQIGDAVTVLASPQG
ncbi:flagellar assembly protein T N-terminal domain-containing protein [Alkalimonas collagenimarina]|uniref:Flagellar assembly protein T N-terminal domain-containing protein n=1 Tax=Alkalimonas collagenimarina TaxID=400390 RepID=A0ABT9GY27_9GAMM|nr:flagellar assembly protein T N-terminal domain-containing protein [Alkalimonas collagenimarina]MDP4535868.1 flagellar assembly protein T N-terminal domain-containing protein [Alkalimonas collagenimarina]